MVSLDSIPISLVGLLLLVAPGLIGIQLLYHFSNRKFSLTRTRLIVYSSAVSGISVFILYVSSYLLTSKFVPTVEVVANILHIATEAEIEDITLSGMVGIYILHIFITLIMGIFVGYSYRIYKYKIDKEVLDPREPWEFTFTNSPDKDEEIEVLLTNGDIIRGYFNKLAFDSEKRELFLDQPFLIEYSDDGQQISKEDLGRSMYLASDAILRVAVIEEDPDTNSTQQVDEFEIGEEFEKEIENILSNLSDQMEIDEFEDV